MRWPVGRAGKDLDSLWYNAQAFGVQTTYGYHEGDDFNLKTGGDSDLNQPLYAIAKGTVTSVHLHTAKPTFGTHVHIQHPGPWGTIYAHYAHCASVSVAVGDNVAEGQEIGRLGKSGTTFAHLHFAIKNQPTGIDALAKTISDLTKWENPTTFIKKWSAMDMYNGYDLDNKESMKVAVDVLVRVQQGEFVEKAKYAADVKSAYDEGYAVGKAQAGNLPDVTWEPNGLTIEKTEGDTKTITNYKKV